MDIRTEYSEGKYCTDLAKMRVVGSFLGSLQSLILGYIYSIPGMSLPTDEALSVTRQALVYKLCVLYTPMDSP